MCGRQLVAVVTMCGLTCLAVVDVDASIQESDAVAAIPSRPVPQSPPPPSPAWKLPGVVFVGATEIDPRRDAPAQPELGFGIDMHGKAPQGTTIDAAFVHGWAAGVSRAHRYGLHDSRAQIRIASPGWTLAGGELRTDRRGFGVATVADGVSVQRTRGRVMGGATVARPKYFGGGWGGHLVEASVGLPVPHGTVGLTGSDLARSASRTAALPSIRSIDDDSALVEGDLERLGTLLARDMRVRSAWIDSQVRVGHHTVLARGGWLETRNAAHERVSGPAAEARYAFTHRRGAAGAHARWVPPVLPGTSMAGDLLGINGRFKLGRHLQIVGRGSSTQAVMFGRAEQTDVDAGAAGFDFIQQGMRLEILANYREAQSTRTRISRSVSARVRLPIGPAVAEGRFEVGEMADGLVRRRIRSHRAALYIDGGGTWITTGASYQDYGVLPPRARIDVSAGWSWRDLVFEGGSGLGRSEWFGNEWSLWAALELPLPAKVKLSIGADYDRWDVEASPYLTFVPDPEDLAPPLRLTVSVQRPIALPMPFLR